MLWNSRTPPRMCPHRERFRCMRDTQDQSNARQTCLKGMDWRSREGGGEEEGKRRRERERERERRHVSAYAPSQTKKRERSIEADTRKIHRYRHTKRGFTSPLTTTVYPKWTRLCRQNCTYFPRMSMTLPHAVNARNALGVMITIQCALYAH